MTNFRQLDKLTEEKFLRRVVSPCGDLVLYGYTDHCTFKRKWNKYTLNARGTVYELSTGKTIAQALPKFFNFTELSISHARFLIKQKGFETFEKVDGSLGIIYNYRNVWNVNTRGSFSSTQAIEGTQILKNTYNMRDIPKNITLMVEIIYPENRIIVDYGSQRKLVLLAAYDSYSGKEVTREQLTEISNKSGMELIKSYQYTSIDELIELQSTMGDHEEGFVVRFANGERVKFKSKEYLKLARLIGYVTPLHFWEHMEQGKVKLDTIEKLPEEFRDEVDRTVKALEEKYRTTMREVCLEAAQIIEETKNSDNQKKAIGLRLKELKYSGCVFTILDGKPEKLEEYVMKTIRPKGNVL